MKTADDYNKEYVGRGFKTVLLQGKKPTAHGWQRAETPSPDLIPEGWNVGVVLGSLSAGLVDIDIDDDEAIPFADRFLPETQMTFGRGNRRTTHRLFKTPDPAPCEKFIAPGNRMLLELRGNGTQTMFPGSLHPLGQEVTFDVDGEPSETTWSELRCACKKIAIATLMLGYWKVGSRHKLALALAGVFRKANWSQEDAVDLIKAITEAARDDDVDGRLLDVRTTYSCELKKVSGYRQLRDLVDEDCAKAVSKWAGVSGDHETPPAKKAEAGLLDTDMHCAEAFSERNLGLLAYCVGDDRWYLKNSGVFDPISFPEAIGIAMAFAKEIERAVAGIDQLQNAKRLQQAGRLKNMLDLSRHFLKVTRTQLDTRNLLIGCKNGVIDLDQGCLLPEDHESFVTKRIGAIFDADAKCPMFTSFLDDTFGGNSELIAFVQRVAGYCLSGSTGEQCAFWLVGAGANGKSTLLGVLAKLLGDYAATTPPHTLMVQKFGNEKTDDLAQLVGKRMVLVSETESGAKLAIAKFKRMTGGDRITARSLYKDQFEFDPQFKLFLTTNEPPDIGDNSEATWRRINVIQFAHQVPEARRNGNLQSELLSERSGILNWALEGFKAWRSIGLNPPECIRQNTAAYRNVNDSVKQFIDDKCEPVPDGFVLSSALYTAYDIWCRSNGIDPLPKLRFPKELPRFGFESRRRGGKNGWLGVRLRQQD